jgi:hypothetical protein
VIKHLRFTGFGLWDERLVKNVENILADVLEFGLDLLAVIADGANILVSSLGLLLLFNGGDYAPGSTTSSYDVLVGNGKKVTFVDRQFTAEL